MKKMISFGNYSLDKLIGRLFWTGNIPIALFSYFITKKMYFSNVPPPAEVIQGSENGYSYSVARVMLKGSPLNGLMMLLILFVLSVVLWKLCCEIIFIILKYFNVTHKKSLTSKPTLLMK